jgi:hypothetical protein
MLDVRWRHQTKPCFLANVGYRAVDCNCCCLIKRCRLGSFACFYGRIFTFSDFYGIFLRKEGLLASLNFRLCLRCTLGICAYHVVVNQRPQRCDRFAIASDALASIPTLTKAWTNPETESVWPFIIGVFGASSSLAVATLWTFSEYAFPSYLVIVNLMVLLALYNRKLIPLLKKN